MSPISHQLLAILMFALGALVAVSGQTLAPRRKPPPNEPQEKYTMPPAHCPLVDRTQTSSQALQIVWLK
jgi:hypothetical protein